MFAGLRPQLFGIAYQMLGSAAEAEDVVQETWLRWQGADRADVRDPAAFLVTVATRLAINVVRSARKRREQYAGPWLPEPVDTARGPEEGAEQAADVELAVLLLLERLSPPERAAYVLRESFDYPFAEIAAILQVTEANARQLASRARRRLAAERRNPVSRTEHRRLLETFIAAARTGDLDALEELLAEDAVSYSDGGGAVRGAARIPVAGRERVARFVVAFAPRFWPGATVALVEANGHPAALLTRDGTPFALLAIGASDAGVDRLLWVLNPAKLRGFAARGADG
ncbi:RNA polymerase sigma-70 factor, ECF subfamily [Actinomadura meyerae]|uniref:RNA polymerase sigma-70 factor, ECF subfamily n=1 Tax=Actinomadura meyerae TaxID=240840 RepID=A0A239MTR7_9ACTN|nr:RNA polymerase sigma-70 factor, ECF subfamily [Actinomadura meyerae]